MWIRDGAARRDTRLRRVVVALAIVASLSLWSAASAAAAPVYRVNVGGPEVAGFPAWSADTAASPSPYVNAAATTNKVYSTGSAIALGPSVPVGTPASLFQTERYDPGGQPDMQWSFPVQPGQYEVKLFFAETYSANFAAGRRVFNVAIEGQTMLSKFDPYVAAGGGNRGVVQTLNVTSDSTLNINFSHLVENPSIDAIEISPVSLATASLAASSSSLAFGSVVVGQSGSQTVTLSNGAAAGGPSLTVASTSISGADGAQFADDYNDAPRTLAPGESFPLKVTFSPTSGGAKSASVVVQHSGSNAPLTIPLSGTGATAPPPTSTVLARVNAGGASVAGSPAWSTDTAGSPSSFVNAAAVGNAVASTGSAITLDPSVPAGTPTSLFQTERYDPGGQPDMQWDFPATAGQTYEVRLFFAETYSGTQAVGARQFDVSIDGALKLNDFDIYAQVGGYRGVMKAFPITSDGNIDIDFTHVVENPEINAIEIVATGSGGGATASLAASSSSLAFGSVVVGQSGSQTVTLSNGAAAGGPSLTVASTSISGADGAQFADDYNDAPRTLAPGESFR